MKNFETFRTEEELLRRIDELRADGFRDNELEIISSNEIEGHDELAYDDINVEKGEASLGDKIAGFFTGENPELRAFEKLGFDEETSVQVMEAVNDNCFVLHVKKDRFYDNNRDVETGGILYEDQNPRYNDRQVAEDLDKNVDTLIKKDRNRDVFDEKPFNKQIKIQPEEVGPGGKDPLIEEDLFNRNDNASGEFRDLKEKAEDEVRDKKDDVEDFVKDKKDDAEDFFRDKKDGRR